nr:uncharacterized protein LOC111426001 [Onthophagus taurus]
MTHRIVVKKTMVHLNYMPPLFSTDRLYTRLLLQTVAVLCSQQKVSSDDVITRPNDRRYVHLTSQSSVNNELEIALDIVFIQGYPDEVAEVVDKFVNLRPIDLISFDRFYRHLVSRPTLETIQDL